MPVSPRLGREGRSAYRAWDAGFSRARRASLESSPAVIQRKAFVADDDSSTQLISRRRKLLLGVPFGLAALQGCGGAAAATTSSAPAPTPAAPTPSATPAAPIAAVSGWAARGAPSAASGQTIFVPDVGSTGSLWFSNGTAWVPLSNPLMLAHKFSNASMDASVGPFADVLLDSFKIPAYVLGAASGLRITSAWSFPGGGSASKAPQIRAYFGVGTYASSATTLFDSRGQFATQSSFLLNVTLQNQNSMSVNQTRPIDYAFGASGNAFQSTAIDFTQDVTIGLGALNNSSSVSPADQQVLDWFSIEMLA